jgi:ABC-type multidrug transport system permease subunit
MGFIFFQLPTDSFSGVQDRLGLTFFICVNQTFGTVMPTINVFPDQKIIIKRERAAGTYRAFSGFFSKFLSTLPLVYAGSLLLSIPIYWMIGFQKDAAKYFAFILIILVQSHTANALGVAIGSFVPSARVGQVIAPLVVVIFLIFGGQFVNLDNAPDSLKWIQYISFISYSNKALAQNEFYGLNFSYPCPNDATLTCNSSGESLIRQFALDNPTMWYCVLINVGLSVAFTIIGAIGFAKTTAPLMRLSADTPSESKSVEKKGIDGF